jgi:WXG100 family type VII secretion target
MAGNIAMDEETVRQAAIDTTNTRLSVDENLRGLKNLCDDLAAQWTGAGGTAMQNVMMEWDIQAAKLLDALSEIADMLDQSAAASAEADAEGAADFNPYAGEL